MDLQQKFEQAKAARFKKSDFNEIRQFCKLIGVELDPAENKEYHKAKQKLIDACGLGEPGESEPAPVVKKVDFRRSDLVPPYRLRLDEGYEGLRHCVIINPPNDRIPRAENEKRRAIFVNGYWFEFKYGELVKMPDPVWQKIKGEKIGSPEQVTTVNNGVIEGTTTVLREQKYWNYEYHGVDPDTADRAKNIKDWYQQRGIDFFRKLKLSDLRIVATALGIGYTVRENNIVRNLAENELRDKIYIDVFSDIPVFEDEAESA